MNSQITFPSHRDYRFYQGLLASFVANSIQAVNFLGDRFLRKYHLSAGLEELLSAEQKPSSYLAMSQGAHAGRLLLSEYREDLKRSIFELAKALQRFDDDGLTALLCDVSAPRSAATDTRAERRRFVTNACVYATFVRGIRLGVIDRIELEGLLGRELSQYKQELLGLFGKHGYIR